MRQVIDFECGGERLVGTLDDGSGNTGLLLVSGGNEIRSGAYSGQAAMAAHLSAQGHPVFRYDRRGVGDSAGVNGGFEGSAADISAAVTAFRSAAPHVRRLVAFGNCDAAAALALFHRGLAIDALLLANPWVIEAAEAQTDLSTPPSAAAIRARYLARLKNPRSLFDLVTGKIDLGKLAGGLAKAAQKDEPSGLAKRIAEALAATDVPVHILIAGRDTTAMAFMGSWQSALFAQVRDTATIASVDTASHSFADADSRGWLYQQVSAQLR